MTGQDEHAAEPLMVVQLQGELRGLFQAAPFKSHDEVVAKIIELRRQDKKIMSVSPDTISRVLHQDPTNPLAEAFHWESVRAIYLALGKDPDARTEERWRGALAQWEMWRDERQAERSRPRGTPARHAAEPPEEGEPDSGPARELRRGLELTKREQQKRERELRQRERALLELQEQLQIQERQQHEQARSQQEEELRERRRQGALEERERELQAREALLERTVSTSSWRGDQAPLRDDERARLSNSLVDQLDEIEGVRPTPLAVVLFLGIGGLVTFLAAAAGSIAEGTTDDPNLVTIVVYSASALLAVVSSLLALRFEARRRRILALGRRIASSARDLATDERGLSPQLRLRLSALCDSLNESGDRAEAADLDQVCRGPG